MNSKEVRAVFSAWAKSLNSADFREAAVFGSLVGGGATPFDGSKSDLDAVLIFAGGRGSPWSRANALKGLIPQKESLENTLRKTLEKANATERIASLLVVTDEECQWDISKADCAKFFSEDSGTSFWSAMDCWKLTFDVQCLARLTPLESISDLATAIIQVQKARNQFVDVNGNGKSRLEVFCDPEEAVPKTVMRWASLVSTYSQKDSPLPTANKFDLNAGLQSIQVWVTDYAGSDLCYGELMQTVARRVGRGRAETPLDPFYQIVLWEIVFQKAIECLDSMLISRSQSSASAIVGVPSCQRVANSDAPNDAQPSVCACCHAEHPVHTLRSSTPVDFMCVRCMQRATDENWGPRTLELYREFAEVLQGITYSPETGLLTCKIPTELHKLRDERNVEVLINSIAEIAGCPPQSVRIELLEESSTLVTVTIPVFALRQALLELQDAESWHQRMTEVDRRIESRILLTFLLDELRERINSKEEKNAEQLSTSIGLATKAIEISRDLKLIDTLISLECNLGTLYEKANDFVAAESHHRAALDLEEVNKSRIGIALHSYNLGRVLFKTKNLEAARLYLEQARDIYRELRDDSMEKSAQYYLDRLM